MGVQLRGTLIELPEGSYVHLRPATGRAQKHGQGQAYKIQVSVHDYSPQVQLVMSGVTVKCLFQQR